MIRPWFQPQERQDALESAARAWEGTPYFANAASRGHGVGCVNLVHELFFEAGAITKRIELPIYQTDYAHHSTQTQLLRFLMDHPDLTGRLLFVPVQGRRLPGDLFGVRSGHVDHHLACAVKWGKVAQAIEDHGVVIVDETEKTFASRILYVLRLMEVA
ncbi:MAG: hypothetical protein WC378_04440 [Opitutaceae bacterium]|jgi:hypothetical protein